MSATPPTPTTPKRAIFVSDIHLTGPEDPKTERFAAYLKSLGSDVTHLFLVGDIFDLWVADHDYFKKRFVKVIEPIQALAVRGVEVHYFEGNHDLHLEKFWGEIVTVHPDDAVFKINNVTVRVEHGDLINPDDKGYLFLRKFLRRTPMTFLAYNLPDFAVKAIGERASKASRDYTSNAKSKPTEEIRALIRRHAEEQYAKQKFDLIVTGHVHVKDDFTFNVNDHKVRSINLGSWYEEPQALVIDERGTRFEPIAPTYSKT